MGVRFFWGILNWLGPFYVLDFPRESETVIKNYNDKIFNNEFVFDKLIKWGNEWRERDRLGKKNQFFFGFFIYEGDEWGEGRRWRMRYNVRCCWFTLRYRKHAWSNDPSLIKKSNGLY